MKLALIGATGFVGSAILKEALDRGHQVKAIVRNPGALEISNSNLSVVQGDVMDTDHLSKLLSGSDAILSAYNPGWSNPDIYNEFLKGYESIQQATLNAGLKRILVIGGAGSLFLAPGLQVIDTPNFPEAIKPGASAAREYLTILQKEEHLDWTYLSPAIEMHQGTSGQRKGTYRTGFDNPVFDADGNNIISVEDIAVAVLDEIENPKHIRQRFTVAY